jgi:hypothetical protein
MLDLAGSIWLISDYVELEAGMLGDSPGSLNHPIRNPRNVMK